MGETDIIRPASPNERADYVEIVPSEGDILSNFMAKASAVRNKYAKEYKPYDYYSARLDFDEEVKSYYNALATSVKNAKVNTNAITNFDFEKYGEPTRFEFLGVQEITENKFVVKTKIDEITSKYFNFRGKARGNGISIYVPDKDVAKVQDWVDKVFKGKETEAKKGSK